MADCIVRTHGGLGNQIFQIFYANCLCLHTSIGPPVIIHDSNYPHKFKLDSYFRSQFTNLTFYQKILSWMRIPKVLSKIGIKECERFSFLGDVYLDGYFQTETVYAIFDKDTITATMEKIKEDLDIPPVSSPVKDHLVHLRLTDFFKNQTEELNFLDTIFDELDPRADIISNNDALVETKIRQVDGPQNNYHLIPTSTYSAYEILRLMLNYSTVSSNNSTLAFWAVLFSGNTLHLTDDSLKSLFQHLKVNSSK